MRVRRESQIIPWFLAWPADEVERLLIEIRNKAEISWREILKVHLGHVGTLMSKDRQEEMFCCDWEIPFEVQENGTMSG